MIRKYRVVAQTANGFQVVGIRCNRELANLLANEYMLSLDPNTDECPEMLIEACR